MSRDTWVSCQGGSSVSDTGLSPAVARLSSRVLLQMNFVTPRGHCNDPRKIPQPLTYNARRLTYARFRLIPVRSPLLGESRLISFPRGTEMVQFPPFASFRMSLRTGFPIRRSPGQSLLAARRGLSQLSTSFIASKRQGIHHTPLVAWSHIQVTKATVEHGIRFTCQRTLSFKTP